MEKALPNQVFYESFHLQGVRDIQYSIYTSNSLLNDNPFHVMNYEFHYNQLIRVIERGKTMKSQGYKWSRQFLSDEKNCIDI